MEEHSKHFFKKLYFVWDRFGGGMTMGCYQPYLACSRMGVPAAVNSTSEIESEITSIKDSALFFMKGRPPQTMINNLRENDNVVVYYPGDGHEDTLLRYLKNIRNINGVIVGSTNFKNSIDSLQTQIHTTVVPANHDIFLKPETFKAERESEFRLYFGGSRNQHGHPTQGDLGLRDEFNYSEGYFHSLRFMEQKMRKSTAKEREHYTVQVAAKGECQTLLKLIESKENPSKYSCHYAIRAPWVANYHKQWNTKTGGKVSTAAIAGANIITSLDPSVRELIDEEYPYSIDTETDYFKENYQDVCCEMVTKARETFNTKIWQDGLEILKKVKERTSTQRITMDYINFFNQLHEVK